MKIEALTLLETDNHECPNIGTVIYGNNTRETVERKIKEAIQSHFDNDIIQMGRIDWTALEGHMDTEILVDTEDGINNRVSIQRTWIY